jgi:hypothetical protein
MGILKKLGRVRVGILDVFINLEVTDIYLDTLEDLNGNQF